MLGGSHRKFSSGGIYEYVWVNMHTLITSECVFHETSLLSCLTDINDKNYPCEKFGKCKKQKIHPTHNANFTKTQHTSSLRGTFFFIHRSK